MNVSHLVAAYTLERDLSHQYAEQLRHRLRSLDDFCGRPLDVAEVTPERINTWLIRQAELGLARPTVKGYRTAVIVLLNYAHELGMDCCDPRRIRRIKCPAPLVHAWTLDEVRLLFAAAADEWLLYCRIGYETGLRRGDILRLTDLSERFSLVEHKTGRVVVKGVRPATLDLWRQLGGMRFSSLRRQWYEDAAGLVSRAGLAGTLSKTLRRTHATHNPGGLQHTSADMARRYYEDVTQRKATLPPEV